MSSLVYVRTAAFALVGIAIGCASDARREDSGWTGLGTAGVSAGSAGSTGETDAASTDVSSTDGTGAGAETSDGDGPRLDVGPAGDTTGGCEGPECEQTGCTAVDLLFVIDNSGSMQPYQAALAEAFPTFARAILEGLEPGVNLHVGVTSTEMGYSSSGQNFTQYVNGQAVSCTATGDGDAHSDTFYQTPDVSPTATNGAQGRLYVAGGMPYFDLDTDAPEAQIVALETWFSAAAQIGEFGSNVEMSAAAAAWATHPANAASNAGFLRDEGAVLVLFFVQDEHDQTPTSEAATVASMIADAKQGCGGFDCVVGGGFVNEDCLSLTPLGGLFDLFSGDQVVTETLPDAAAVTPEIFESALRDTLAQVIIDACDKIEPPV
jgi:hypothetical protein